MRKFQNGGVKCLPLHPQQGNIFRRDALFSDFQEDAFIRTVKFIADQGESEGRQSGADLMLSAGVENGTDEALTGFSGSSSVSAVSYAAPTG